MYEWIESTQKMIDWIDENINVKTTLNDMSKYVGYSPYYCSRKFHDVVGMTLKKYISGRRLCIATIEIRDTEKGILDIAIECGYLSHEALTRAFIDKYGISPSSYRKNIIPLTLFVKKVVLSPVHYIEKGEFEMNQFYLTQASVRVEYIPAHKYIGIWDITKKGYGGYWETRDCDDMTGLVESFSNIDDPIVTCHTAGWFYEDGKKGYFYGTGIPMDYDGDIPEGWSMKEFAGSYYLKFSHPKFDYIKDNGEVMGRVEDLAWNFDPATMGYKWNEEDNQDYQRHSPEVNGYEVLRPVAKL